MDLLEPKKLQSSYSFNSLMPISLADEIVRELNPSIAIPSIAIILLFSAAGVNINEGCSYNSLISPKEPRSILISTTHGSEVPKSYLESSNMTE